MVDMTGACVVGHKPGIFGKVFKLMNVHWTFVVACVKRKPWLPTMVASGLQEAK